MVLQDNRTFDELFDAIDQFTLILDERGKILKANNAALVLFGKSLDDILNRHFWILPWPSLSKQSKKHLKRAVAFAMRGNFVFQELELHQRNQPEKYLYFSFKPVFTRENILQFILIEGRDITGEKQTHEALYQSEARFKSIYEKSAIGMLIKNSDGKVLDSNPAFLSMVGYQIEELLDMDYLAITHPSDRKISRKLFTELVTGKRKNYLMEKRYITKDGQIIWAHVTASLVESSTGQPQFVIAMVDNITAQKQLEAEMDELRGHIMQGREMERLKIAQDLHDGPLQEIIGISYELQSIKDSDPINLNLEQLESIQIEIKNLANSIRSICGELRPPTLIPFGIKNTILSHAGNLQKTYPELTIQLELPEDDLTLPEQIRIVLFRIYQEGLNNIIRHAQASKVCIRLWSEEAQVVMEILDNGVGFEIPARWIFFARQGHLGLVGARERAQEIGGSLEIQSAPGSGTHLSVIVPLTYPLSQFSGE